MKNEIIVANNYEKAALYEAAINKLSGVQMLKLTGIVVGGVILVVGVLCLSGYDFNASKSGVSFAKHDVVIPNQAAKLI